MTVNKTLLHLWIGGYVHSNSNTSMSVCVCYSIVSFLGIIYKTVTWRTDH